MSRGPRPEASRLDVDDWRPTASLENLRRRAELLACLRDFFAERGVLEVETPLMASATVTDLHLASFHVPGPASTSPDRTRYLQTSPEFAMKRLVASGSGPIYQICKAFRQDEAGRFHNPEFTILEWYRPEWDHYALMDEMDALLSRALGTPLAERATYAELFEHHVEGRPAPPVQGPAGGPRNASRPSGWSRGPSSTPGPGEPDDLLGADDVGGNVHDATVERLARLAETHGMDVTAAADLDRDTWLHLLWSHLVEPELGRGRPTFVMDFPASQAALARVRPATDQTPAVAERFEVYVEGVELANGFHELADAAEQRKRFAEDLAERRRRGLETPPMDERLLAALEAGFPDCAGVALGFDRLLLLAVGGRHLNEVMAFPFERA